MKEKILITGTTGIISKELLDYLHCNNVAVRIAIRDEKKRNEYEKYGYEIVKFDFEDSRTYSDAFQGISGIYLSIPYMYPRIDEFIVPAIEYAKKNGVIHIVTIGAVGIELDNETPLSILEKCIQYCGLQYTILRPNLLMQNILTFASQSIHRYHEIKLPAGDARISYIDARDVAEAAGIVLTDESHRNKVYNLTGSEALSHSELAAIISKVSGKTITYRPVSHNEMKQDLEMSGWNSEKIETIIGLYEIARHGWCEKIWPDLSDILERDPITFEQFAENNRDAWNISSS